MKRDLEDVETELEAAEKELMKHMKTGEVHVHVTRSGNRYEVKRREKRYARRSLDRIAVAEDWERLPPIIQAQVRHYYTGGIRNLEEQMGAEAKRYISNPPRRDEISVKRVDDAEGDDNLVPESFEDE